MPESASGVPQSTTMRFVIAIVVIAIAVFLVANPETRESIMVLAEKIYGSIKCLFGECAATEDDKTAMDSTKALACTIDVMAYWTSVDKSDLETRLKEIETSPDKASLFRDKSNKPFASCTEGVTSVAPTTAPTAKAIDASINGALSKISELSGGNMITGNAFALMGSCPKDKKQCIEDTGLVFYCDMGAQSFCGKKLLTDEGFTLCSDASGCEKIECINCGDGLDLCDKKECQAISEIWTAKKLGVCNFKPGLLGDMSGDCNYIQTKAQAELQSVKDAEKILKENPGKSIRFGKAAAVCNKGGTDLRCCKLEAGLVTSYYYEDGGCTTKNSCILGCSVTETVMDNCKSVSKPENLVCKVKAFELPQDVTTASPTSPWPMKGIGGAIDFGRAWIGAMGDPHYLVYYETFPPEGEEAWMYSGWDVLLTSFATGAVLNLGVGGVKVAATGVKAGGLYVVKNAGLSVKSLLGFEVKAAERQLLKEELTRTMSARLANEFGGGLLLRGAAAKATEQKMIMNSVGEAYSKVTQTVVNERLVAAEVKLTEKVAEETFEKEIGALELLVSGEAEITEDVVKSIAPELTEAEVSKATNVLRSAQADRQSGKLIEKDALRTETLKRVGSSARYAEEFKETYMKMEASIGRAAKSTLSPVLGLPEKAGIASSVRWIAKNVFKLKTTDPLDKLADEMAKANYERMTSKMVSRLDAFESGTITVGGETISASSTGLRGVGKKIDIEKVVKDADFGDDVAKDEFKALLVAWNNLDDPAVKSTIWDRAGTLVKTYSGTPALDKIPTFKRQAVMATAITLSYIYMLEESKAEKYLVSQNSVVLTWPMMWTFLMKNPDDPANFKKLYVKTADLKSDTWVQMKIPAVFGEGGMPLYLASPCKADIELTKGMCKCKQYGGGDRVLVRFSTVGTRTLDMDGPIQQTFSESPDDPVKEFPAKITTTLKEYIGNPAGGEAQSQMMKDILAEAKERTKTAQKKCDEPFVTECNLNVIAVPVNIGPSVEGGYETRKVCTEEGWLDFLSLTSAKTFPCIQISVDSASMSSYAANPNYKQNFCRVNKGKSSDMAQVGIEAGVAVGSIALMLFPVTAPVGTALILGVGGGVGTAGAKYLEITSKWPESQY